MKKLEEFKGSFITIDEIEKFINVEDYHEFYNKICEMIVNGIIKPVQSSKINGKNPPLYSKYRIIRKEDDNSSLIEELNFKLSIEFDTSYYKKNINKYKEHREDILLLNNFFLSKKKLLEDAISMNERSFQIWGKEKFLQKGYGKTVLKNLGLDEKVLNYYDTSEPLAYYSISKDTPQKVLIIENKDTYYTFRKHLINGNLTLLGENIKTIIYGKGKNINKTFKDFEISVEEHVSSRDNEILYLGDIDYEGIVIYESFYKYFSNKYNVKPFVKGYIKMIDKVEALDFELPLTKDGQNKNIKDIFFEYFNLKYKRKILNILEDNLYIPQEILNIKDL
ncbi:MAG: hypothetical protein GX275_03260 [Clostridiales bacterium]|nr:hypothetical protein [Clostridiales bacterium]